MCQNWETIQAEWLLGQSISLSQAEVMDRFEVVKRLLGQDWLSAIKTRPSLTPPILNVMLMADKLTSVSSCAGFNELLVRIKSNDRSAHSELTAAFLLASNKIEIEFGPVVDVNGKPKRPDIRIKSEGDDWCYIEVASPNESELQAKAQELVQRIAEKLIQNSDDLVLDCILLKEPSGVEENHICTLIASQLDRAQPSIETIPELAIIAVNQNAPGQAVISDFGAPSVPRIAITKFQVENGQTRKTITVRVPFTDERAEGFISREARQLPDTFPGLIMFDMTANASGMAAWRPLLVRRLQPKQHTRVGAVCLFTGNYMLGPQGLGWFPDASFLRNAYACHMVPDWIAKRLEAIKLPRFEQ
jgi:hypothetical protein